VYNVNCQRSDISHDEELISIIGIMVEMTSAGASMAASRNVNELA